MIKFGHTGEGHVPLASARSGFLTSAGEWLEKTLKERGRDLALVCGVFAAYFFSGKLGLTMAISGRVVSPVWPPTGIAIAALLLLGYRVWPGILAGAFLVNLTALSAPIEKSVVASLGISIGNTLEALAGAWLARRFAHGKHAFRRPQTIFRFVGLSAMAATLISPLVGLVSLSIVGLEQWVNFAPLGLIWWLGDVVGAVVITPLLLLWVTNPRLHPSRKQLWEGTALGVALTLTCGFLFFGWFFLKIKGAPLALLLMPYLLWSTLRFGRRGTITTIFVIGCAAIIGTIHGRGPFSFQNEEVSLLLLQEFIGLISVMALVLAADVAQRRETDEALRLSEVRYRELFEDNPQPMWVFDYDTLRFVAVNQAALLHHGYSREEFLSMRVTDIRPAEDVPGFLDAVSKSRKGEAISPYWRHRKKDGSIIEVQTTRHNLLFDGRPSAMVLCTDITHRRQAEKRVAVFSILGRRLGSARTSKEAAEILADAADTLFGWDGFCFELYSPEQKSVTPVLSLRKFGNRPEQIPISRLDPKAAENLARVLEHGAQLILTPEPLTVPAIGCSPGPNEALPASRMLTPVRKGEHTIGILGIQSFRFKAYSQEDLRALQALADHCSGALERIRAEAALHESGEQLRLALSASQMGIWTLEIRKRQKFFFVSPELEIIFGFQPGTSDRQGGLFSRIHPQDRAMVRRALARALTNEGDYEVEFRILPPNRPLAWVLGRGRAYSDGAAKPARLAGVAIDITERKASEAEILRLNAELERRVGERTAQLRAINSELEAFCYSVSHDLRAPLRSIRGFSEVLLQRYGDKLDPRGQEFLRRACDSSHHMDHLIEDLLQLSRVSRTEMRRQKVYLSALAENILNELAQQEPKRKVDLFISPKLEVKADEHLLRIAMQNLLNNAWKFTGKTSKARIEVGHTDEPEPAFFVRDNGAGFDMAFAGKLFGAFQRLHSTAEFPGTGVGLATVQRIINRHGGRIWAKSAPNEGATFYFTVPSQV
jgi:PAS domain S-box-containing protein